jgi:hypothetical protein
VRGRCATRRPTCSRPRGHRPTLGGRESDAICHVRVARLFIYRAALTSNEYSYCIKLAVSCAVALVYFLISSFDFGAPFWKHVCFARLRRDTTLLHQYSISPVIFARRSFMFSVQTHVSDHLYTLKFIYIRESPRGLENRCLNQGASSLNKMNSTRCPPNEKLDKHRQIYALYRLPHELT